MQQRSQEYTVHPKGMVRKLQYQGNFTLSIWITALRNKTFRNKAMSAAESQKNEDAGDGDKQGP
jgi:hypothetical protein